MDSIYFASSAILVANLAAYSAFWCDKQRAIKRQWRISEGTLLVLAFCGGWPGAKLAQRRFRHKTRKQPFATILNCVPLLWLGLGVAIMWTASLDPMWLSAFETHEVGTTPRFFRSVGN